jgi:signal transduction histidine kinase
LCQSIAVQVAAAVENARLYRDLQAQASQLAELLQLQEDEVRQRTAILESVAEGVIVADEEGQVVIVNAAAERILDVPRRRILGRPLDRLTGPATLASGGDWSQIAHSDSPLQVVLELESRIVHVNAAPVLTPAGDHLGIVAVLRDITKEMEAERAKSEFIAVISHELRTPLTAIQGYAEVLSGGMAGGMSDAQTYFLDIVRENVARMADLTENLIAASDLEREGVRLEYGQTDLHLIAGEVLNAFHGEVEERQLEMALDLDDELPVIEADPARVRQILNNLVSNAVKFTYPGGRVTIGAKLLREDTDQAPAYCSLWVSDTGIGIAPEEQAHIWERFYRPANPLAAEASGLGVGLSIVRSLVKAHSGRVWLESTPGEGSTFTVILPLKRAQQIGP